jgi:hypothetical protein
MPQILHSENGGKYLQQQGHIENNNWVSAHICCRLLVIALQIFSEEFKFLSERLDVWSTVSLQLCFICPLLLPGRCSR